MLKGARLPLLVCLVLALPASSAFAAHNEERVFVAEFTSTTAVDISVETSQALYPDEADGADVVLVARDDGFADALASAALQGTLLAPLLLTPTAALPQSVESEIARLGASRVVILGGTGAVSPAVEARLRQLGPNVDRIAGPDRITTAAAIAAEAVETSEAPSDVAIVVRAFGEGSAGYADALAAGGLSTAGFGLPILLTETERLSAATAAFISDNGIREVWVLGGRAAVSDAAFAEIDALVDVAERVSGSDRFGTALAAARLLYGEDTTLADTFQVFLIDANDPLAWATGFTGAHLGGLLSSTLLVAGSVIPAPTAEWLAGKPIDEDELPFRGVICGAKVASSTCHDAANMVDAAFES